MKNKLLKLFFSTFYLSAFTFGGGYVIVSLMREKFVNALHWIEEEEMLDLIAIAQSAPGAIAVNGAIVVGYKIAGFIGAVVSILGTVLPPFFIISIVSIFYRLFQDNIYISLILEGMQIGVSAVILKVVIEMIENIVKDKKISLLLIMVFVFVAHYYYHIQVIYLILGCLILGIMMSFWRNNG